MSQKVYCLYCGYCLNSIGIKGDCPECGEEFDKGMRNGVAYESLDKMNTTSKARWAGLGLLLGAFVLAISTLVLSSTITHVAFSKMTLYFGALFTFVLICGAIYLFGFYKPKEEAE